MGIIIPTGEHAFEVLRTANQTYREVDFFVIEAKLPDNGQSASSDWCRDYQKLCGQYGLRPTGCGEDWAVEGGIHSDWTHSNGRIRCVTEYNSDPYINNVLGCASAWRVAAVANRAFSAWATWGRSFGFLNCGTSNCQRGIRESHYGLYNISAAFRSDESGDRIVYTVCAGSAGNDACAAGNVGCAHACIHTRNSYRCICPRGFTLMADVHDCEDTDECATGNGGCAHNCTNLHGSYNCSCLQGYVLKTDKHGCEDIDQCARSNGGCEQTCTNTPGGSLCSCQHGYILNQDGLTCDGECYCNVFLIDSPGVQSIAVRSVSLRGRRSSSPPDSTRFPGRFCCQLSWAGRKLLESRREPAPTKIAWTTH
ncbi:uncharacterized protein LOC144922322 [Branchiostoma floridae x Branchiostoma belcheri]